MMDSCAINIDRLTKNFGEHTVLNNLTFQIPENKITTILGFSGAGKSTLLKHILGLMEPSSGSISVLGQDLSLLDTLEKRNFRKNFGMLFQYAALFDSFTAFDNIAFPLREFTKKNPEEIDNLVRSLFSAVGLKEEALFKFPSELSGGMRKRVGLARALALEPKIMLYDEPTTGLDPITTKMVNDLIVDTSKRNAERGMTTLIISHDVKATLEISDYVAFLDHGSIVEFLPTKEFVDSKNELVRRFLEL